MDVSVEEVESLQREFDWVLDTEVTDVIDQLRNAVQVPTCWFHSRDWPDIRPLRTSGFFLRKLVN